MPKSSTATLTPRSRSWLRQARAVVAVLDEGAFGNLDPELPCGQAGLVQDRFDGVGETGVVELAGGYVHPHVQAPGCNLVPGGQLSAGCA